jgi:hypothetical protein
MKNKTKIRLHLSKNLFETIAKEVLAEAKVNGGGAYTEVVKTPKQPKKIKEVDAVADTDKMKKMEEMSSKEKMAKGLYKEDAGALQPGENVTWLDGSQREYKGVIQSQEEGDYYKVKITVAPVGGHKVGDVLTKQSGDLKKAMGEMQINVAEEDTLNEIDPSSIDWSAVAAALGAIGLAPFLIDKIHNLWKKKFPKSFEKAQGVSGAISKQAGGNEPDDKEGQVKTGKFESTSLNELRKQTKNK